MFDLPGPEDAACTVYAAMPPTPQHAWPLLAGCGLSRARILARVPGTG